MRASEMELAASEPYAVAYEAIVTTRPPTGARKVKVADAYAKAAVRALERAGLLAHETQLRLVGGAHGDQWRRCPTCGQDVSGVALTALAYTFETCTCPLVDYAHLVEQVWHRTCLEAS